VASDCVELINYMIAQLHIEWEIAKVQDIDNKVGNGFTVVIRKIGTRRFGKKYTNALCLEDTVMVSRKTMNRIFPSGTVRRKIAKVFYELLFGLITQVPQSTLAHKYCIGKGLEIGGSAHNPFGLNTLNVDFTDSMDTEFKKEEINLCGKALKVDIVANGDDIPLPDESQDFIVSSHVIEHFPNPIKALVEWDRLVKAGGIIFMIVPHKERTFDKHKASTPLSHIVEDFKNNNTEPHTNPDGHDHCWVTKTFIELIRYMIENLRMEWEIVEVQDIDDKAGNGFTIVLRKIKTQEPVRYVQ